MSSGNSLALYIFCTLYIKLHSCTSKALVYRELPKSFHLHLPPRWSLHWIAADQGWRGRFRVLETMDSDFTLRSGLLRGGPEHSPGDRILVRDHSKQAWEEQSSKQADYLSRKASNRKRLSYCSLGEYYITFCLLSFPLDWKVHEGRASFVNELKWNKRVWEHSRRLIKTPSKITNPTSNIQRFLKVKTRQG